VPDLGDGWAELEVTGRVDLPGRAEKSPELAE
jgi:hypothetical protein